MARQVERTAKRRPGKGKPLAGVPLEIDGPRGLRRPEHHPHAGLDNGFGDYTESGQVIPVSFEGRKGGYSHCMFLNDHPPIAGGREL